MKAFWDVLQGVIVDRMHHLCQVAARLDAGWKTFWIESVGQADAANVEDAAIFLVVRHNKVREITIYEKLRCRVPRPVATTQEPASAKAGGDLEE